MKFFCVVSGKDSLRGELLAKACVSRGVEYVGIDPEKFDYTETVTIKEGDMLYRASAAQVNANTQVLENILLTEKITSFYRVFDIRRVDYNNSSHIVHDKEGLPIPRTISHITNDREMLKKYIEYLGGLPVVLKAVGGSEGIGVIKVDSYPTLLSLVDYMTAKQQPAILRQFVAMDPPVYSYRAVVVGDKVEFVYRNESVDKDDFRSNANQQSRKRRKVSLEKAQQDILVQAVHVLGLDLGAVDFVLTGENKDRVLIFEVNFPFNFIPVVSDLNYPLHEVMIEFLLRKRNKKPDMSAEMENGYKSTGSPSF